MPCAGHEHTETFLIFTEHTFWSGKTKQESNDKEGRHKLWKVV